MEPKAETGRGWCERTAADLSSLLVEWTRALKATGFYDAENVAQKEVIDRAFLAWQIELERAGPVEIWIEPEGFRGTDIQGRAASPHLSELADAFRRHGVERIALNLAMTRESFHAVLENLADPDHDAAPLAEALRDGPTAGFEINGEPVEARREAMPARQAPIPASNWAVRDHAHRIEDPTNAEAPPILATLEGASLGSSLLGPTRNADATPLPTRETPIVLADLPWKPKPDATSLPSPSASTRNLDPQAPASPEEEEPRHENSAPTPLPTAPCEEPSTPSQSSDAAARSETPGMADTRSAAREVLQDLRPAEAREPSLDEDPLAGPPAPAAQRLFDQLNELDQCTDDDYYCALAGEVVDGATRLAEGGLESEAYRAMLVLCDHSTGAGGRSGVQLRRSLEALNDLAQGERLAIPIERMCAPGGSGSVRAAQVMLQLDGRVVPQALDQLANETDADRAAQLRALVIALGESAVPALETAIRAGSGPRARRAVQLAGELQTARLVPALIEALQGDLAPLGKEAARALAPIGGNEVRAALIEALASPAPGVPAVAASCLGQMADPTALRPLMRRLDEALEQRDHVLARDLIRALGLIGAEAAVPKLVSVLERRSWVHRKAQRDLKIAAIAALERMSGREALRALHRAAGHSDPSVRSRVQQVLDRRPSDAPAPTAGADPEPAAAGESGGPDSATAS